MKIRTIKAADIDTFKEMNKEFYESGATRRGYDEKLTHKTFGYLTSTHHNLFGYFMMSDDGEYCGYALLTSYWCNEEGGEIIILDEIYVNPKYRKHGMGGQFLKWAEHHFNGRAVSITLEVLETNVNALEFYTALGYIPDGFMTMTKSI